ncbi:MAG: dTDP-4-dehydrorhamnose reductase [Acidobacteriota bacterium]|nr:dTDP-4-dehydrorhamnose reductase [Acidobacteriota bacterium]
MSSAPAAAPVSEALPARQPALDTPRRVLLTGAAGMLATDLLAPLARTGYRVFPRTRADLDVTDAAAVSRAFREVQPDVVLNCAAFTKVDDSESNPLARAVNARAVANLAIECSERGATLVQISTDFVFDGEKGAPYVEEDPTNPLSEYGRTKREGEEAALAAPGALVVRSSWLFGRGGRNFVEAILQKAERGDRELRVVSDQRGRPTATPDLAEATVALLQCGASGVYHFANRGEASWFEFAQAIVDLAGRTETRVVAVDSASLGRPAKRPAYSALDTTRFEKKTGLPVRTWKEALADYLLLRARPEA